MGSRIVKQDHSTETKASVLESEVRSLIEEVAAKLPRQDSKL